MNPIEPKKLEAHLRDLEPELMARVPVGHVERCCNGMNAALSVQSDKGRGR